MQRMLWRAITPSSTVSVELDDVLDAGRTAAQKRAVVCHWEPSGDQRFDRFRPTLGENREIANRSFEGIAPGVHRAENYLILEHEIAHHQISVDFHRPLSTGYAGKNEYAVIAELLDHLESQTRCAGRFIDQIDGRNRGCQIGKRVS